MTTTTRYLLDGEFVEEVVDADTSSGSEAEAEEEDDAAVEVDEADNLGEKVDLFTVAVVEKPTERLGEWLVGYAHVVVGEDIEQDAVSWRTHAR